MFDTENFSSSRTFLHRSLIRSAALGSYGHRGWAEGNEVRGGFGLIVCVVEMMAATSLGVVVSDGADAAGMHFFDRVERGQEGCRSVWSLDEENLSGGHGLCSDFDRVIIS